MDRKHWSEHLAFWSEDSATQRYLTSEDVLLVDARRITSAFIKSVYRAGVDVERVA